MHCDKCEQPLQPWETTTCEPCGEILKDSSTAALTQTETKVHFTSRQQGAVGQTISKGLRR